MLWKSLPQPPQLGTSHPFLPPTKHLFRLLRARPRAREPWLLFKPHLSRSLVGTNPPKSRWMGSFLPQPPWDWARGRGTGQVQAPRTGPGSEDCEKRSGWGNFSRSWRGLSLLTKEGSGTLQKENGRCPPPPAPRLDLLLVKCSQHTLQVWTARGSSLSHQLMSPAGWERGLSLPCSTGLGLGSVRAAPRGHFGHW